MNRLKSMVGFGLIAGVIGLVNYFTEVTVDRSLGLHLFIAGTSFLAAALVGLAVVNELKQQAIMGEPTCHLCGSPPERVCQTCGRFFCTLHSGRFWKLPWESNCQTCQTVAWVWKLVILVGAGLAAGIYWLMVNASKFTN